MLNVTLADRCVVDADGFYKIFVTVQTELGADETLTETVLGYKLKEDESLIETLPPGRKEHASGAGFVKPRWDEDAAAWVEGATAEELAAWETEHPAPAVDLDAEKARRIQQSNDDLEDYLLAHPLQWTDGEYYAITQKKQNQLTSKISVAQAKAQLGVPYELKWNTTGEVCVEWKLADLMALAFAIDERVTKLVEYQQTKEIQIKNAGTIEELNVIEVDYDTVQ
ncbi:hypothetical protein [Agathobaculum sp. Marseille-P7918]|uniref:hypothetical protein n=1 Tax=Agathobaculum sp. Marseille-P7918 TaxID=2479843 RepID=UPI000F636D9F|nr:hypothetical protein [Agathobaculum sp. Marseille-P7918]